MIVPQKSIFQWQIEGGNLQGTEFFQENLITEAYLQSILRKTDENIRHLKPSPLFLHSVRTNNIQLVASIEPMNLAITQIKYMYDKEK